MAAAPVYGATPDAQPVANGDRMHGLAPLGNALTPPATNLLRPNVQPTTCGRC